MQTTENYDFPTVSTAVSAPRRRALPYVHPVIRVNSKNAAPFEDLLTREEQFVCDRATD